MSCLLEIEALIKIYGNPAHATPICLRMSAQDWRHRRTQSNHLEPGLAFFFRGRASLGTRRGLGHVLLGHKLVASTAPNTQSIGRMKPQRGLYEREAKVFAIELLVPIA